MAHGRGGRTPRRDTPRVSAIGLARTPTLRKAVAFEQGRGSKPPLRGDRGSGGGARAALRNSVGTARAHTLVHLLPLVASSGMRKQTYLYGLGIRAWPTRAERRAAPKGGNSAAKGHCKRFYEPGCPLREKRVDSLRRQIRSPHDTPLASLLSIRRIIAT